MHHKSEIYGNTMADLRSASIGSTMLGVLAGVGLCASYYKDGRLANDWPVAVIAPLVIGSIIPLIILPTCLFSIRVDEQYITHLLRTRCLESASHFPA